MTTSSLVMVDSMTMMQGSHCMPVKAAGPGAGISSNLKEHHIRVDFVNQKHIEQLDMQQYHQSAAAIKAPLACIELLLLQQKVPLIF